MSAAPKHRGLLPHFSVKEEILYTRKTKIIMLVCLLLVLVMSMKMTGLIFKAMPSVGST